MSHENYRYRSYRHYRRRGRQGALGKQARGRVCVPQREFKVNLEGSASIRAIFDKILDVDAVISCAGNAAFRPFVDLTDADYELGLRSKLMGQVTLARIAKDHLQGDECAAFRSLLRHACLMPW